MRGQPPGPDGHGESDGSLTHLIQRSSQGDDRAFSRLYDATVERVHALAVLVAGGQRTGESATRAAYVEIWRSAASYDPALARPLTWMLGITHDLALHQR